MTTEEVVRALHENIGKRVLLTWEDDTAQWVDIHSVDDEGVLHSGANGEDPAHWWTRFEDVKLVQKDGTSVSPPDVEPKLRTPAILKIAQPAAVAPAWHTIVFLAVIFAFAAASAHSQHQMIERHGRVAAYLLTMGWEYALVVYILWGARKKSVRLRDIVGGKWTRPEDFLLDVAVACGFWLVAAAVLAGLSFALGLASASQVAEAKKQLGPLLPRTGLELGVWIALSATAGLCEEIMFRGYLQKQFRAATHSTAAAIVMQAIVFGIAHAYQGGRRIVLISVYGALFGMLAAWRKSLRPGMMQHALQDTVSGVAFRLLK
ncbi:MAG: CPBP family intramembrane metalloprotease [Acidobacteriia bacterium]|nr:CPBP family intramembrane metalloprotease [Terriglobia bacterium]